MFSVIVQHYKAHIIVYLQFCYTKWKYLKTHAIHTVYILQYMIFKIWSKYTNNTQTVFIKYSDIEYVSNKTL